MAREIEADPRDLVSVVVELEVDGGKGAEREIGDEGEDCRAAAGDAVLDEEECELGEELIDLNGGFEVREGVAEGGGEVDSVGLGVLERGMTETEAGAGIQGAKAAAAAVCGKVLTAWLVRRGGLARL